eukprot:1428992-Prymnesium_polylepis.1
MLQGAVANGVRVNSQVCCTSDHPCHVMHPRLARFLATHFGEPLPRSCARARPQALGPTINFDRRRRDDCIGETLETLTDACLIL